MHPWPCRASRSMLYEATNLYSEEAPTIVRPKIKHLAFVSRYPDKLAKFYEDVFGTDGYPNLAIMPCTLQGESAPGLQHFGFQIDDMETTAQTLMDHRAEDPKKRPPNSPMPNTGAPIRKATCLICLCTVTRKWKPGQSGILGSGKKKTPDLVTLLRPGCPLRHGYLLLSSARILGFCACAVRPWCPGRR